MQRLFLTIHLHKSLLSEHQGLAGHCMLRREDCEKTLRWRRPYTLVYLYRFYSDVW